MSVLPQSVLAIKTRVLWAALLVFSLLAAVVAVKVYLVAAPGLSVEITLSRTQALAAAEAFQREHFPALQTDRQALTFVTDHHLQNYVELEAGGVEAFQALVSNLDAVTHYWKLRSFTEGQEEELILAFSPRGDFISFALLIPAQAPGPELEETAARALAEAGARLHMGARFEDYVPLETRVVRQTTGRADHSFTYEHARLQAGEARFRLNLKVAGDQLVAVDTFKHIPEAFNQRFGEMRALNTQISQISTFFMLGLFGLCGLVGGGIWLYRRHQLRWRAALAPAAFIALGLGLSVICNLPSSWMGYRTTDTVSSFLLAQAYQAGSFAIGFGLLLSIIFAVAEGLSRMAFVHAPRLFDAWRSPAASSPEILGRILGGYVWTGLFLAYAVLFILLSTRVLGWWSPAGTMTDPNILSSWRPALAPIFTALQAGTWEECVFRAIPLALAVIIGRRFNILKPLVVVTLILQAVVFAGVHANYPQMPGYSRLIELFIPALAFGLVYLRFGLIPCIVAHFLYDLVLMSLPIFIAEDASLWLDRMLVISIGLAPLCVLVYARWRQGSFQALADTWRNGVPAEPEPELDVHPGANPPATTLVEAALPPLGLAGRWMLCVALVAVAALAFNGFKPGPVEWPEFSVDRAEATRLAEAELSQRGVTLVGEWRRTVTTHTNVAGADRFVWRESGADIFQSLIGRYLDTPYWVVTWRRFDGPVEERSESWAAWLYPDGQLHELVHNLPEGRPGAKLSRAEALVVARDWILRMNWPDPLTLEEKSVEETIRPERTDWYIRYLDKAAYDHNNGQAVISVKLSGDEVTGYVRSILVPQEWYRADEAKNARKTPFRIAAGIATFGIFALAMWGYLGKHSGRRFRFKIALPWMLITSLSMVAVSLLWIDPGLQQLDTTMSWNMQLGMILFMLGLGAAVTALICFLVVQVIYAETPAAGQTRSQYFLLGVCLALGISGLIALQNMVLPYTGTPQAYAADYATFWPWLTTIGNGLKAVMPALMWPFVLIGLLRFCKAPLYRAHWRQLVILGLIVVWVVCSALAADEIAQALVGHLVNLLKLWLMLELIRRQQLGVAIVMVCAQAALNQFNVGHALYPLAWLHGVISALVLISVGYWLMAHWHRHASAHARV